MTVGEVARRMGVTVRTLQYYDKEGVLSPSQMSEGGFRLYSYKDVAKLQQVITLKYLGFSLADIKSRLPEISTPAEVSEILTQQAQGIREKLANLEEILESIEKLNEEVLQMDEVNWEKYAAIVSLVQSDSDTHWIVKHFPEKIHEHTQEYVANESDDRFMHMYSEILEATGEVQSQGHAPESLKGQEVAKMWWEFVMEFTKGDAALLNELFEMGSGIDSGEWNEKFSFDKEYISEAVGIYAESMGYSFENNEYEVKK